MYIFSDMKVHRLTLRALNVEIVQDLAHKSLKQSFMPCFLITLLFRFLVARSCVSLPTNSYSLCLFGRSKHIGL